MIQIPNPKTRDWTQPNAGDILGNVFSTKNIDFDQKGYARLAKKSMALLYNPTHINDIVSLSTIDGGVYYPMNSNGTATDKSFTLDGALGSIASGQVGSDKLDGVIWQGLWHITQDTTGAYLSSGSWTTFGTLTTAKYHPVGVHEGLNYLAIGNGNTVLFYDTSHTLQTTLTLPTNFEVRWIRYSNNYVYIGTRNLGGGNAVVFQADGVSTSAAYSFTVPSSYWVYSGCIHEGVLCVFSSIGQLLRLNGSGFSELAHLPVYDNPNLTWGPSSFDTGSIAQRGMISKGDRIYVNIDGYINSPTNIQLPNQPSGLWCYDPKVGLYHKAGLSNDVLIPGTSGPTFSSYSNATGIITVSNAFTASIGTKILCTGSDIGGVTVGKFYYLIVLSTTTFKLASTYDNAIAGTNITLSAGGTTFSCLIHADANFGESLQAGYQPGAIVAIDERNGVVATSKQYTASQFIWGGSQVYGNTGSQAYTLQTLTVGYNRGYIVTTKVTSQGIKDMWQRVMAKCSSVFQGADKIIVKYKIFENENYPILINSNCTFTNSTTFTTAFDLSNAAVGDELEITSGRGAGCCVHISTLTNNSGTWTVVVDEAIPGAVASDVFTFGFIQKWIKTGTYTNTTVTFPDRLLSVPIGSTQITSSKWIQFKIEIRGISEPYIEELQIINKTEMPSA